MSIDNVILEDDEFDEYTVGIVPLDPDGKPVFLGDKDSIFLKGFPLDIIHGPKQELYVLSIVLEFILPLLNRFEILENEPNKIRDIRLVDSLSARSLGKGVVCGKAKLQGRQERQRPHG